MGYIVIKFHTHSEAQVVLLRTLLIPIPIFFDLFELFSGIKECLTFELYGPFITPLEDFYLIPMTEDNGITNRPVNRINCLVEFFCK